MGVGLQKREVIKNVAERVGLPKQIAAEAVKEVLDIIASSLTVGKPVVLTGFGTFKTINRHARRVKNPMTGEWMRVPDMKVIKFDAGKTLKDYIRGK